MAATTRTPAERRRRRLADLGEVMITLGAILMLFVAYQLWWTNVSAARAAEQAASGVQQSWASITPQDPPTGPRPATPAAEQPEVGTTFGLVYIPRLKDKVWALPLIQGVGAQQLAQGIGHYVGTAMPGEIGNFATAGHRATHGEPLRDIDQIQKGDQVVVETESEWFTYELDSMEIVSPSDVWVIDPVPGEPDAKPTQALITLTTCNPRWASTTRWIWWGHLVDTIAKSSGERPVALQEH
jgi:sortase A